MVGPFNKVGWRRMKIEYVRFFLQHCRMVTDGVLGVVTRSDIRSFCRIQHVFDSLRKDDLLALSLYLNLNVKKSWRKIDIQRVIVKHLISIDVFDESSLSSYCVASDIEIKKLEINAQLEFKKLVGW